MFTYRAHHTGHGHRTEGASHQPPTVREQLGQYTTGSVIRHYFSDTAHAQSMNLPPGHITLFRSHHTVIQRLTSLQCYSETHIITMLFRDSHHYNVIQRLTSLQCYSETHIITMLFRDSHHYNVIQRLTSLQCYSETHIITMLFRDSHHYIIMLFRDSHHDSRTWGTLRRRGW